jgi:hypothetical protein
VSAWRELAADQRRAAGAAVALLLTLFLPWYGHPLPAVGGRVAHDRVNAFGVFSFVEAAILLTAAAVLYLFYARSQRRGFHLPGGDGWAVTIAGAWVVFLLVWRLFDKPDFKPGPVGVEWGLFVAMAVGGLLVAAGQRLRAAHVPEPANPAADDGDWETPERRRRTARDRRPVDPAAFTRVLRDDAPSWEGEPPEPPGRARPAEPPPPTRPLPAADDEPGDPRLF